MQLIPWWNVFHFFWLTEHLYKSWADIFPNFLKSTISVSYPLTNYLQHSCVRQKNKMSGSEESSQVLIEAPWGTGCILCVVFILASISPQLNESNVSCLTERLLPTNMACFCFFMQHFLSFYSVLANDIQKKFMATLHCLYQLVQRGVLILPHRISHLHQRAVQDWWEPQLWASLLASPSFIDSIVLFTSESTRNSTTLPYHLNDPSFINFQ